MVDQVDIDIYLDEVYIEYPNGDLKLAKISPSWDIYETKEEDE